MFNISSTAGLLGYTVESYSTAVYAFLAPYIASDIFPNHDNPVFYIYMIYAVASFLVYPIGCLYYGIIGDKLGRKRVSCDTILGLSVTAAVTGCIPVNYDFTYIVYFFLIGAQAFFSGGEHRGSVVLIMEHTKKERACGMSGVINIFAVSGLFAAKLLSILHGSQWLSWRVLFFITSILGFFVFLIRKYQSFESPEYTSNDVYQENINIASLLYILRNRYNEIIDTLCVSAFFGISYSFIFLFLPVVVQGMEFITLFSLSLYAVLLLGFGMIGDSTKSVTKFMVLGSLVYSIIVLPIVLVIENLPIVSLLLLVFACIFIGPKHAWLNKQFTSRERCRSSMISCALSTFFLYFTTTPILLFIYDKTENLQYAAIYVMCLGIMISLRLMRKYFNVISCIKKIVLSTKGHSKCGKLQ